ncbi:tetratricopeptide repeat protein [candidate division KSB1 bacterium]|nr:tetratricopeptide repeat protein [candidate division KSB1 bacterium]
MGTRSKIEIIFLLLNCLFISTIGTAKNDGKLDNAIKLFEEQKYDEAKKIFEQIASENPKNHEPFGYMGQIYLRQGDYDNSIDWYKKAVKLDGKNSLYHFQLGQAYGIKAQRASIFKKVGAAKNVKKEFAKAVELDSLNIEARFGLMQFYLMAPGIMGGDKDEAKNQAKEISKINKPEGHLAFGVIYEREENVEKAQIEYKQAIEADANILRYQYNLARVYGDNKKLDQAFEIYEKILKNNPEDLTAYYQVGRLSSKTGENLQRGKECLHQFIQAKTNNNETVTAWAHYRLGLIHEKEGNKDEAKKEFETALKINPDHKQAKKALKNLK